MIGDSLIIYPENIEIANFILDQVNQETPHPIILAIAGESGSGKSSIAYALQETLRTKVLDSYIMHMDDYWYLPPKTNHESREANITKVGPNEVNLELLDLNLAQLKSGNLHLSKPLVHYKENIILSEEVRFTRLQFIIVEGVYVSLLKNVDYRIFIDKNYKQTLEARLSRARDQLTPFVEQVLKMEHQIVSKHKKHADLIITLKNTVEYASQRR